LSLGSVDTHERSPQRASKSIRVDRAGMQHN